MRKSILSFLAGAVAGTAFGFAVGIFIFPFLFPPPPAVEQLPQADQSNPILAEGTFIHANPADPVHYGKGSVSVRQDSVYLGADFTVGPGPKFHVYLVPRAMIRTAADVKDQMFVDLGRLRSFQGSQRYTIPAGVDVAKFKAWSSGASSSRS
jgi:hypothetical protein